MNLLSTRRFLPLFVTQFLGALNDNLLKNALVMLITFRLAGEGEAQLLVTLAAGLFILPFFLFSATAGQVADKIDRAKITRIVKLAEIVIMLLAAAGFYLGNSWFLLAVLFAMGVHSTFFGPIKYALLPQHLREDELLAGNAWIEAGTFLAILIGTILGGVLVLQPQGIALISAAMLGVAIAGYLSSRAIPEAPAPQPELKVSWNIARETWRIIHYARESKRVFRSIMGISWFWLVGATYLSQFPTYVKDVLQAEPEVVTMLLTVFSVGIGIGSALCNKLLRGQIQSTYVPLAAIGMAVFGIDLVYAESQPRILFDLLAIAICGGLYIVPLYALMQQLSAAEHRARIIAANNVLNALFMVGAAAATLGLLAAGCTIQQVFLAVAVANIAAAAYICRLLPDALLRSLMRAVLRLCYRLEVRGMEHYLAAGSRVLLVANHTSFLDAALIAATLPEKITFAVNTHVAQRWWMKPLLALVDALPLDPTNPLATKTLIDTLKTGRKCMIFPEGRITVTGALMKIYEGPGMIADKSGAVLLPIRIDGAQYTPLSRLRGKVRLRWFPKVTLTFLPPCRFALPEEIKGRKRRQLAGGALYDVMAQMIFETSPRRRTLFAALVDAAEIHGGDHVIIEDVERKPLTYHQAILRSFVLGRLLCRSMREQKYVGVLLPNAVSTVLTFFALHAFGKVPAMLNFTAGSSQMLSACRVAMITTVITSRRFVQMAKLEALVAELEAGGVAVKYLEDLRKQVSLLDKLYAIIAACFPRCFATKSKPEDAAVILFTSGSEGVPKGVVLSHENIQANRYQLSARVDFGPQDIVFNALPMFHSFGLTGGTLLPVLSGIRAFYYPSPLHYRIVPELVYDANATIMFGTDTFLSGYARFAHPYDFHSLRYVFAGAEKLKEETRKTYAGKYGVRIFEGYGATETSPVLATNTPMQNREGSVGRLMPGIDFRLDAVPGIEDGGQLWVRGPNVMLGYFKEDKPGELQPPQDGWYDTGDIVAMDAEGYITIKGRTKRFAKIGGEMVSLTAVETVLNKLWPEFAHAVVSIPDEKKGEQLALLTTFKEAKREAITKHFKEQGINELAIPRKILHMDALPLLGTGKVDYQKAKGLALATP